MVLMLQKRKITTYKNLELFYFLKLFQEAKLRAQRTETIKSKGYVHYYPVLNENQVRKTKKKN